MLEIIHTLADQIKCFDSVDKVVLYGSRARRDCRDRSDIDLAVVCPKMTDSEWLDLRELVDAADTLYFIDLVRLDRVSDNLKRNIEREGVTLYDRKGN